MLALLLAASLATVGGLPVGYAEALCDLGARAHAKGDATFLRRSLDELRIKHDDQVVILSFCLGRAVEKRRNLPRR